jgi:hypothetical protein
VNALANEEVGSLINKHFVSSFQRVGTFKINNGTKQGGNVAVYFCAPDGKVLDVIAGPVNAKTLLEEANWVLSSTSRAITDSKNDGTKFKALMRRYHADRLQEKHGVRVTPVLKDQILQDEKTALAYRDRDGRSLAPILPLPPIENQREVKGQTTNDAKVHRLLAAHAMMRIENLYGAVFEGILGEKVSTKPVEANSPFTRAK